MICRSSKLGIVLYPVGVAGHHPIMVKAWSLLRYCAIRSLGCSTIERSKRLGISPPSVSISIKRGEKIATVMQLKRIRYEKIISFFEKNYEYYNFMNVPIILGSKLIIISIFRWPDPKRKKLVGCSGFQKLSIRSKKPCEYRWSWLNRDIPWFRSGWCLAVCAWFLPCDRFVG